MYWRRLPEFLIVIAGIFFIAVLVHEATHGILNGSATGLCIGLCPAPTGYCTLAGLYAEGTPTEIAKGEFLPNLFRWASFAFMLWWYWSKILCADLKFNK